MTVLPIVAWTLALVVSYVVRGRRPRFNRKIYIGLGLLTVAFAFFARGLDEDNDYLRLNHGLWHLFSSLAFYNFFHCLDRAFKKFD